MADSSIGIVDAAGATRQVDGFTQANGDLREAVVVGDPTSTNVAAVIAAGPAGTEAGVVVRQAGPLPGAAEATAARAQIAASTTAVAVWAARAGRKGGSLCNRTSGDVSIAFAGTVTLDDADIVIGPGQVYELPSDSNMRITTAVSAIWSAAATGTLRAVEWF